jgi:hypothetical protein
MNTICNVVLKTTAAFAITTLAILSPVHAATGKGSGDNLAMEKCANEAATIQYKHPGERKFALEQQQCEKAEFAAFESEGTAADKGRRDCKRETGFVHPAVALARQRAGC